MTKSTKTIMAHIVTGICLLAAGAFLYYLISNVSPSDQFLISDGQGTIFDFNSSSGTNVGFNRETIIYTESGITSVTFSGKVTVEGTAEISIVSDEDGSVVYCETYTDVNAKSIEFEVADLTPYAYYTLRFSSDIAKTGHLTLTTDHALVKSPEHPEKSMP